jgi:death on curing protein
LAAAYALGIARNHAFVDGNRRTGWVVCGLFLELNGVSVTVDEGKVVDAMFNAAMGAVTEDQFAQWLEEQNPNCL